MADKNTEHKIKQAFSNAVPDIRGSILSDCKSQKGAVIIMTDTNKKTFLSRRLAGIAAAFVLLIGGLSGFQIYRTNYSAINREERKAIFPTLTAGVLFPHFW